MARMTLIPGALLALVALMAPAGSAQDARAVLQASAKAMGLDNVRTIQYSAAGWNALVGQSFNLTEDWPRFEVVNYTRTIDYDASTSREEYTRRRGSYPVRGGGAPFDGEQRVVQLFNGFAWNMQGDNPVPPGRPYLEVMPHNELRHLEIMLTPHGFLKAAMAATDVQVMSTAIVGPTNAGLTENGRRANLVAFTALGKYRVVGTINDRNLVELTTTWIPNAVYGDMLYEIRHLNYKDFGGVQFPTQIHVHQGDPVFNPAHNQMDIRVSDVRVNVPVPAMAVPDSIRQAAAAAPPPATPQRITDGVWLIGGGSHHSVAIEFADHMAVIEAPLNEARSLAVLEAVAKIAPDKLVRYIVNTHHHFDHSSGLRTYIAQGSTLVTHRDNADFYEQVMFHPAPRTLQPDRLALFYPNFTTSRRPVPIERVNQKYVLSDGTRTVELHPIQGSTHIGPMLIAYLPQSKILVNADLYTPPAAGAQIPSQAMQGIQTLARNIERLKLDVAQHATLHGMSPSAHDAFQKLAATAPTTN